MPIKIIEQQRRLRELGRIRLGDKGDRGQPQKLSTFRLTSSARHLLDEAAALWGGQVRPWAGAPAEGYFELYTDTDRLPVAIPPGSDPVSSWYELWSGGGCQRRCDGEREWLTDQPCLCDPDKRECKPTTRINLLLPDIPDVGVWRLESHGLNVAYEFPGIVDLVRGAQEAGIFLTGTLRIEHRTSKKAGQTRKFIVPVLDLDASVRQLMGGGPVVEQLGNGERPAIEAGSEQRGHVARSDEGDSAPEAVGSSGASSDVAGAPAPPEPVISAAQVGRFHALKREAGLSDDEAKRIVKHYTGQTSSRQIPVSKYDAICADIQAATGELVPREPERPAEP